MPTKNYSVRLSDEAVIREIESYAADHGVAESTAIARLLAEGRKAKSGKPISRFAVLDAQATKTINVILGELRSLDLTLRQSLIALKLPRPILANEQAGWDNAYRGAADAGAQVKLAIDRLKRAGQLEVLLHNFNPVVMEENYNIAVEDRRPTTVAIYGLLLGKPTKLPPLTSAPHQLVKPGNAPSDLSSKPLTAPPAQNGPTQPAAVKPASTPASP